MLGMLFFGFRDLGNYEEFTQFKYLGTTVTNQNLIQEEVKRRLKCLLPFSPEPSVFLSLVKKSKNENIQDYNFACGFVWVRTWSLTLREEHRLRVFENKVLRRIFGPKRDEVTGG
jgi:hypothetical protein